MVNRSWTLAVGLILFSSFACEAQIEAILSTASSASDARTDEYAAIARQAELLDQQLGLIKRVVRLVTPTVVHLDSFKSDNGPDDDPTFEEAGSGVVIDINGQNYILTNRHVISNAALKNIQIRLHDGRHLTATNAWSDPQTDVAVIQVSETGLTAARIGDSDEMEIGDFVLAVGSPFGLSHSISYGIISAKGRRDLELGSQDIRLQDFIQTDAAINPGNSGGPLLNLRGEVIGINTAIASNSGGNEGVSFAIPSQLVMFAAKQLIESGNVEHAFLGVTLDNTFGPDTAKKLGVKRVKGALVKAINPASPAFFANIKINDLIVRYNGQVVEDDDHLVNLVSLTPVENMVTLDVVRERQIVQVKVKLGKRRNFE